MQSMCLDSPDEPLHKILIRSILLFSKLRFSFIEFVRPVSGELVLYIGNLPTQIALNWRKTVFIFCTTNNIWLNVYVTINMTMMITSQPGSTASKWILVSSGLLCFLASMLAFNSLALADDRSQIEMPADAPMIVLVGEDEWYPYSAYKDGKLQGLAVDVIEAAYAAVNVKVKFKTAPYVRCMMLAESGQELGCFDSLKDSKLVKTHLFHNNPIFKAEIGIYAKSDSKENNLKPADLKGKHVGVTHGYTYSDAVDGDQLILREVAPTDLSNLRKLLLNRSEYSLVYTRVVDYLMSKYPAEFKDKIRRVGSLNQSDLYLSFSKHRPESKKFANLLDTGLRKIRKNGVYAQIEQKWRIPAP